MRLYEKIAYEKLYTDAKRVLAELLKNTKTAGEYQFIINAQEAIKKAKRERNNAKKSKKM